MKRNLSVWRLGGLLLVSILTANVRAKASTEPLDLFISPFGAPFSTAVGDTVYDFENLNSGATINGLDNWNVSTVSTSANPSLAIINLEPAAGLYTPSKCLVVGSLGGNNRLYISRVNDLNFSLQTLDSLDLLEISFDLNRNFWGNALHFGFDANNDGHLSLAEVSFGILERDNGQFFQVLGPGAATLATVSKAHGGWTRFRLSVDLMANNQSGSISVSYQDLEAGSAFVVPSGAQNINLGFDLTATNSTNPTLINALMYRHEAGANSALDNIRFVSCEARAGAPTGIYFNNETSSSISIDSISASTSGADGYAVFVNSVNSFASPGLGHNIDVDTNWNGAGQQAVYVGSSLNPSVNVTGLDSNQVYFFKVYAYSICNGFARYEEIGFTESKVLCRVNATVQTSANVSCNGFNDGSISVLFNGVLPANYSWSNGATFLNSTVDTSSITMLSPGIYSLTVTDANGCADTISTQIFEPAPLISSASIDSAISCFGLSDGVVSATATGGTGGYSYNWSTSDSTSSLSGLAPGTYFITITDSLFCTDSSSVTLLEPQEITGIDTRAECGSYSWIDGNLYTASNNTAIYTLVGGALNGCDSTVTLNLTINPVYSAQQQLTICAGDSALIDGAYRFTSGSYTEQYTTVQGCDSIIDLSLIVLPEPSTQAAFAICAGDSMMIHGVYRNVGGVYTDTYPASNGCDSVSTVSLALNPVYSAQQQITICAGDSALIDGAYRFTTGSYTEQYTTVQGCDSIIDLSLIVLPEPSTQAAFAICAGDSMMIHGVYRHVGGVYTDTYPASNGCDSVSTVSLALNPVYSAQQQLTICAGDSALIDGAYRFTTGSYTEQYSTVQGCDSIIDLSLIVLAEPSTQTAFAICAGDSMMIHGVYRFTQGTYTQVYPSNNGCDSTAVVELIVNATQFIQASATICNGDGYTLPDGTIVFTQGTYTTNFINQFGCDSIIETVVNLNPTYFTQASITICKGDSVMLANGVYVFQQGSYTTSFNSILGCDSTFQVDVSFFRQDSVRQVVNLCAGNSALLPDGTSVSAAGIYSSMFSNVFGCDSLIETEIIIRNGFSTTLTASVCAAEPYTLADGSIVTGPGNYQVVFKDVYGCDSTFNYNLTAASQIVINQNIRICQGESYVLPSGVEVRQAGTYQSQFVTNLGCDSLIQTQLSVDPLNILFTSQTIVPGGTIEFGGLLITAPGIYFDTLTSVGPNGCDSIIRLTVSQGVGINQWSANKASFSLYPNPANYQTNLIVEGLTTMNAEMKIFDINGRIIQSVDLSNCALNCQRVIDLSHLMQGVYFVHLQSDAGTLIKQLTVIR